jgi:hypothetical protein
VDSTPVLERSPTARVLFVLARALAIVASIAALMSLLPWLLLAAMSAMLFDSPGSTSSFPTQLIYLAIWLHPLGAISGSILTLSNMKQRDPRRFLLGGVLCLLPLTLASASYLAISVFCGGKLAC